MIYSHFVCSTSTNPISKTVNRRKMMNVKATWLVMVAGALCLATSLSLSAQVKTDVDTAAGKATVTSTTVSGTIIYVNGRDLVIKMDDGSLRHLTNVSPTATAMVDGKPITIKDAKVGMRLTKTVTTTTIPKTITTTQTVTGKVWYVNPPTTVILTLDNHTNQEFKVPQGQMFNINGKDVSVFHLKKGMIVSVTKIVEVPQVDIDKQQKLTGSMPPPPPPPPANQPIAMATLPPVPTPDVTEAAPAPAPAPALPKTGSELPLIGLLGFVSLAASFGVRAARRSS
jgi:LPXTG-motif cell wall-anchored protein